VLSTAISNKTQQQQQYCQAINAECNAAVLVY